jgi:hypothetical protein
MRSSRWRWRTGALPRVTGEASTSSSRRGPSICRLPKAWPRACTCSINLGIGGSFLPPSAVQPKVGCSAKEQPSKGQHAQEHDSHKGFAPQKHLDASCAATGRKEGHRGNEEADELQAEKKARRDLLHLPLASDQHATWRHLYVA